MDRRRSVASGEIGSTTIGNQGVGSKLEGLDEVVNVRNLSFWERIFGRKRVEIASQTGLPTDEGEILAMEDLDVDEGGFSWDKLEFETKWIGGSVLKESEPGIKELKDWLEDL
jgi:hypothetical protein